MQVALLELDAADRSAEVCEQPLPPTFLRVFLNDLHHRLGREFLVVAKDVLQLVAWLGPGNEMNVIAHNTPRKKFQALGLLTITKALHQDILVRGSCEYVHPAHRGIGQVVQVFLFVYLVVARRSSKIAMADRRSAGTFRLQFSEGRSPRIADPRERSGTFAGAGAPR